MMIKKRKFFRGAIAGAAFLVLILDSPLALEGARAGMELCIRTVVPSLFPFFVLSMVVTENLSSGTFRPVTALGTVLGISEGAAPVLIPAMLGGYPVGAKCVGDLCQSNQISKEEAERLLAFCSNAGPSFLFGMVSGCFPEQNTVWLLWLVHLSGAFLTAAVIPKVKEETRKYTQKNDAESKPILLSAARAMFLVCCWVILFRIVLTFLEQWFLWLLPDWVQVLSMGFLELTNGICGLSQIADVEIRFLLCACMLSFGGLCVVFQTASVIGDLPLGCYLKGKCLQTLFSFLLSCSLVTEFGLLFTVLALFLVLIFRKLQNSYGNPKLLPV